ncbi:universal stress protein [Microvirga sp. KLBC 81]|uniref:universal stress protein n=1 Tax=Microvirga sp. KLBC 81 TaxID=1862707 RepID=UPI000D515BF2|nr:universal stress protein [Microvirga sp. KLBC 81]PVE21843.1 universal stress protein [Microvirga sp. KLBC 81]
MPFKDLLLVIGKDTDAGNRYALELARINGATLTATSSGGAPSLPAFIRSEMPSDILNHMREDVENTARTALDAFSEEARRLGVPAETLMLDVATGDIGDEISGLARYFDTTVLQQPDPAGTETSDIIEAILFGSGRPVLIVPFRYGRSQFRTVLIAWDEGRPAARAIADALPLLALTERVEIVAVGNVRGSRNGRDSNIVRHLARHGIVAHVTSLSEQVNVANTLLSHAADVNADLIVMGGYGHSRLREIVLGGTTRRILQTMTVPVLMSH